ncbi:MAG TPA: LL-diaminopimelate aminotransferase [Spirochaetota bacterium]|nr:LL-diaminopimelate aminotransferase [Spirochaetota bacterium]HNT10240.1 LL-diaminopimelate aminotransferase [Spirochaetota bacterium]HNV48086.1 LL-diaminopimelate aminotransferase [Spirochaetota bacterium]HPU88342.1 LL-diaminopimelate aminotransferase [Spirochaetota bacterium]
MESYIQRLFADRIGGSRFGKEEKIYKFEKIKRAKREAVKNNPGTALIDLGVGEPDEKAFDVVIKTLQSEAENPANRGYADNGIDEFKAAAAAYLKNVFGVGGINPETEVMHAIGSKSALSMFPSAFINPGDVVLMTVPGYPVFGTHAEWYGGAVHNLPLRRENAFLPDLDEIPADVLKRAKVMVLNYPNNPTGANADAGFYRQVVDFANRNGVIIVQDAAYAALTYASKPLSFLNVPGAKDVGIEIHSLSKSFNMTGWRLAFVAGNELIVKAFGNVKDNFDSGQFIAIQKAGVQALAHPEITAAIAAKYERRLKALVAILTRLGFSAAMPAGTFYLYFEIPKGVKGGPSFATAEEFSQFLIRERLISSVPWDDVGHFIRFSATFVATPDEETAILEEIERRLSDLAFVF